MDPYLLRWARCFDIPPKLKSNSIDNNSPHWVSSGVIRNKVVPEEAAPTEPIFNPTLFQRQHGKHRSSVW